MCDQMRRRSFRKFGDAAVHQLYALRLGIQICFAPDRADHTQLLRSDHVAKTLRDRIAVELTRLSLRNNFLLLDRVEFSLIQFACDAKFDRRSFQSVVLGFLDAGLARSLSSADAFTSNSVDCDRYRDSDDVADRNRRSNS